MYFVNVSVIHVVVTQIPEKNQTHSETDNRKMIEIFNKNDRKNIKLLHIAEYAI